MSNCNMIPIIIIVILIIIAIYLLLNPTASCSLKNVGVKRDLTDLKNHLSNLGNIMVIESKDGMVIQQI